MTDQAGEEGRVWRKRTRLPIVYLEEPVPGEFLPVLTDDEAWGDIPVPAVPDGCRLIRYVRVRELANGAQQRAAVYAVEDPSSGIINVVGDDGVVDRDKWDPG
jgi:hypothetical protein